jgi:hypothetical protein
MASWGVGPSYAGTYVTVPGAWQALKPTAVMERFSKGKCPSGADPRMVSARGRPDGVSLTGL